MTDIKFNSLNELYDRLYPAFNTKVIDLKKEGIIVKEIDLWNYLKKVWSNASNLKMYDMVDNILSLSSDEVIKNILGGNKNDN